MVRTWLVLTVLVSSALGGLVATAAEPAPAGAPNAPAATTAGDAAGTATTPAPVAAPAGTSASAGVGTPPAPLPAASPDAAGDATAATAGVPMIDAAAQAATPARFGVGARLRLTSVPKWLLGLFLDQSVPLTSYTAGLEFFRRSGNFDLVLGLAYQSLSPNPGNWLGKGNDPSTDTDYVQFDGLAAWSFDAAFIMHTEFSENVGMHYGGGVGIGIVNGRMLRTSNGTPGCATSPGDPTKCYPVVCPQGPCTEAQLRATEGGTDGYLSPSRYADSHVPSVYPIVNLVTGIDFRLPNVPGLAMKIEIGYFFPYFFFGPSVAYQI